jgi:hypothetical protein
MCIPQPQVLHFTGQINRISQVSKSPFAMHASKVIDKILVQYVAPLMKHYCFKRKGQRFWLESGEVVEVVELQKSAWNTKKEAAFTINLAVYHPAVGAFGEKVASLPPAACQCTIQERVGRLFGKGLNCWWTVRGLNDEGKVGADVCTKIVNFGLPWLEAMHDPKEMLEYYETNPCMFAERKVREYLGAKLKPCKEGARAKKTSKPKYP